MSIINLILGVVIHKLVEFEAPATKTEYHISVAKKLVFSQFLNTTMIIFIVNLFIEKDGKTTMVFSVLKSGGLNENVMLIYCVNTFLP